MTNQPDTTASNPLSQSLILAKGLEIADREGIDKLSIRKIAKELGKTPMALYRHFDSMNDIQQGILALAFQEVDTAPIPGERWDDTIRRTTSSIRQMHLNHSKARLYLVESEAWDPGLRDHTEHVQKLHREQGIPDHIFARAWRIIDAFLTGFIICECTADDHHETLPDDEVPDWIGVTDAAYSDEAFHDGIEIIIAGIRNLAAPDPCEWRTPLA
ncbi:MAG: TetR/AcrR family transcriptional regulator [Slackia sp.]|nr:TetR/AcrR family transcriptional regulator [Slackia sp.]